MRRTAILTAGGMTLAGLGALVGLAIGLGDPRPKSPVPVTPPVEVRTEIIRKTVNVYRRERPHHVAGTGGGGSSGSPSRGLSVAAPIATRTRSSGTGAVAPVASATPVVRTRSSGSKVTRGSTQAGSPGSRTVKTRSSGAGATGLAPGSSHPVKTRSSGSGGGDGGDGGHND